MQKQEPLSAQDRRRKRGVIVFQIVCYGYLLIMFAVQMYMRSVRNW